MVVTQWMLFLLASGPGIATATTSEGASRLPALDVRVRAGGRRSDEGRELYAFLELTMPIESWPAAGGATSSDGSPPAVDAEGPLAQDPTPAAVQEEAKDPVAEPPEDVPRGVKKREAAPNLDFLLDGPLVRECIRRALEESRDTRSGDRLSSLASRARSSALLPELRLRGGRSTDQSLRLSPTIEDPYRYTQSDGTDLFFEASLAWRLNRLIYSADELGVERLRLQHEAARTRRIEKVLELLADWQAAAASFADRASPPKKRVEAWVRLSVAGFWLDAMTGGWFTDRVASRLAELSAVATGRRSAESE